ncbi:syntaxin [Forsythia ovata]|uniref:Syntaxin n=1 Tax=Forsythia ovata TaxID=205694 RepID=A0ABD1UU15_9LAMI
MKDLEADPDIKMGTTQLDNNLTAFLEEAENVKQEMNSIREILKHLQEANEESKEHHKPEALKFLRNHINSDIISVLKKARTIRAQLEDMDTANAQNMSIVEHCQLQIGHSSGSDPVCSHEWTLKEAQ